MPQYKKISFFTPSFIKYDVGKYKNHDNLSSFVSVRVTGEKCPLNCLHCRGVILKSMKEVKNGEELFNFAKKKKKQGCQGMLISGASEKNGTVPLKRFKYAMRKIKEELGLAITVHTGITVDRELAEVLSYSKVDAAMFDVIGDEETLHNVCNLNYSLDIFRKSLANLEDFNISAVPHIVIGLYFGEIKGELNSLNIISNHNISSLVFVVINPQPKTPMEHIKMPEIYKISEIFSFARKLISQKTILLGCAKPKGIIREQIEELAILNNFDGIAFPISKTIELAEKNGYNIDFSYKCCSLYNI